MDEGVGEKKKKQNQDDAGSAEAGNRMLTVALFIILLAFFIVLNSLAVVDERRKLEALGSLIGSFGILPGGLSPMKSEGQSIMPLQAPMMSRDGDLSEFHEADMAGAGRVFRRNTVRGEVITIQDRVLFDKGNYRIKLESYGFLKNLCAVINLDDFPVEITGHTDNMPPEEKSVDSNWELSSLRALEVLKFFVVIGKVLPGRLTAYGVADHSPIASNETRQTRAKNRRVDVLLGRESLEGVKKILRTEKEPSQFVIFKRFVFRIFD